MLNYLELQKVMANRIKLTLYYQSFNSSTDGHSVNTLLETKTSTIGSNDSFKQLIP